MNIDNANTEPFFVFHRFHETVNRLMKTVAASLAFMHRELGDGPDASKRLSQLIGDAGEPWGDSHEWSPAIEVPRATYFVSEMGIVRVQSAFEDFGVRVIADLSRWREFCGLEQPQKLQSEALGSALENTDAVAGLIPVKICEHCNWDWSDFSEQLVIFGLFSRLRNCIAHRNGRVTQRVVEDLKSEEIKTVWAKHSSRTDAPMLPLPQLDGDRVLLRPSHVIFFSGVCHRIAKSISDKLRNELGIGGLVHSAAYHSLIRHDHVPYHNKPGRAESAINLTLSERFQVKNASAEETLAMLRELGIWERCNARFKEIHAAA